jgi:hypothetical protein
VSTTTISETCGCGANVTVVAPYSDQARRAASEWREGHKHAESVGACGDRLAGFVGQPDLFCILKAGHRGAHSDGEGHWMHAHEQSAPTAAGEGERGEG